MTVRAVVSALAAAVTALLLCACASRGAGSGSGPASWSRSEPAYGSGSASGHRPTSGVVDTFTRSGGGAGSSSRPTQPPVRTAPACSPGGNGTGFAFSIASTARGYPSPLAAAVQFSRHNTVSAPAVPATQWASLRTAGGYTMTSPHVAVHVTSLPDHTWIVDSGTVCR